MSSSYAVFNHFSTSPSVSFTEMMGMRCVIRTFLASPPVSMIRFGSFPLYCVSAKPTSILVFVVGLICAKTCLRYSGTIVLHGHVLTSPPCDLPSFSNSSKIGRSFSFGPAHVVRCGLQVRFRCILIPALSFRAFRNPPCAVSPQLVLGLEPFAP